MLDWKYNSLREARNLVKGKRETCCGPAYVKEDVWAKLVAEEKAKIESVVPMSHQQSLANKRWKGTTRPAPPNCHGPYGKPGFKKFFKNRFGRLPTWKQQEYCRQNAGKPLQKLAEFWKKKQTPPAQLTTTLNMEATNVFTDLKEAGYSDAM